jgi:DNA-binding GntR family transcriptional regulator
LGKVRVTTKHSQIRNRTAQSEVADYLRERILSGRIKAGEWLRQNHIAEELSVSNIPVREALRELATEGFVTIHPHRGAIVSSVSPNEFEEVVWLRVLIEPELLTRAAPNIGKREIAELRTVLRTIDQAKDLRAWGRFNWKFHSMLYRQANMPQAFAIVERLHATVERYLQVEALLTQNIKASQREHYAILECIEGGDPKAAAALLKKHIEVDADKAIKALKAAQKRSRSAL